ncbi:cell division FtsZ family protein [Sphingomonas sp. QA11]|uniref:cell division protein FtsZ n=1 Tax=Sphingomonas sp. QA11 TaxID=2950605 RepID=UPI00234A50F2|nr:cell division protein FtsZ [Sphingomonas sp. QA11]WCM25788.1 cell division FtsZ family protein [Sphingomonas sp. QA11]
MSQQQPNPGDEIGVTLFGVGGAGGNAVSRLFRAPGHRMKIICANTDMQAMRLVPAASQIQLGRHLTGGLGAGARPEVGRAAAREALPEILAALDGTSLCFVAAGFGGGTGTGAAPVIARAARERGILTIGIATKPFAFEGMRRMRLAAAGVAEFEDSVDALVVVCNEHLLRVAGPDTSFRGALHLSDSIVCDSATDFAALVAGPALKRLTFADIRSTLISGGRAVIGYGERCNGPGRAMRAAESALRNPLLEDAPRGARRLLVTIAGGADLGLLEIEEAVTHLRANVDGGAELVWGSVVDPALDGHMRIGITAAGLPPRETLEDMPASVARSATVPMAPVLQPMVEPVLAPVPGEADHMTTIAAVGREEVVPLVEPDRDVLILNSTYRLDLDLAAERPLARGPVRSRGKASLVDRIYFATRELKRSWHRQPAVPLLPALPARVIRVTRGVPQHLGMG